MSAPALRHHILVLASVFAGIAGMGMVFDAASHGSMQELSIGVPVLFIGLWWSGQELGRSILASKTRKRATADTPTHDAALKTHRSPRPRAT